MKKIRTIIWIEIGILVVLIALGLVQFLDIDNFWVMSFESLINIFITASIGVVGFYITISIIENNASKRRKLDYLESQLNKLLFLLNSDIAKLSRNLSGEFPDNSDFLSHTQKIRDVISNIGHFITIVNSTNDQYISLLGNFEEYNQISDYYCVEAIAKGFKKINQRREDMVQNINKILIDVYDSY